MVARKLFICSAIDQCKETVNCCAHEHPHVKTEACIPRSCRYAPGSEDVDCVVYPIEKPAEIPTPPVPEPEPVPESTKEQDIKEAVKKQAKRPATKKKGGAS